MKTIKLTGIIVVMTLLAACAGPNQQVNNTNLFCAIAGGLVGGAAVGAIDGDNGAAAGGAVAGAALAVLLCPQDEEEHAAPVVQTQALVCPEPPPPGALLDENGCAFDSDHDGVVDGLDMCAGTPAGVKIDRVGCPLDSDRDAVADYQDQCPATPRGTIVDEKGCPLSGQKILSLRGVTFATNQAVLSEQAKQTLEQAVTLLKNTDKVIVVRVEGNTDSRGSAAYNLKLSQRRAQAVVDYLVSRGVKRSSLIPVGLGETNPIASNDTPAGRAANRRVDFVVK